jgi:hypothetical protein
VLQFEVLVSKFGAVDALATSAVTASKVTTCTYWLDTNIFLLVVNL